MLILYILYLLIIWWLLLYFIGGISLQEIGTFLRAKKVNTYENLVSFLSSPKGREIPEYKFYGAIAARLIKLQKSHGISLVQPFRQLRKAIVVDWKENKKIKDTLAGASYQYLLLCAFIWFYFFQIEASLELKFPFSAIVMLGGVHLMGVVTMGFILFTLKYKTFISYENYLKSAYLLKVLLTISRPITEIVQECRLNELIPKKELQGIKNRIISLTEQLKREGSISLDECDYIIQEIWDQYELDLGKFNKYVNVLKFIGMAIFILPSFLFILYQTTSTLGF